MEYLYGSTYIKDGQLDASCGRIVIYDGHIEVANGPAADHNYLLRSLAARLVAKKDDVISRATRLYFKREGNRIVISSVRKIDDEDFERNWVFYAKLIKQNLK